MVCCPDLLVDRILVRDDLVEVLHQCRTTSRESVNYLAGALQQLRRGWFAG